MMLNNSADKLEGVFGDTVTAPCWFAHSLLLVECSSSSGLGTTSSEMSEDYESERFLQLLLNKYFNKVLNVCCPVLGGLGFVVLGQGGALQKRPGQDIWLPGG